MGRDKTRANTDRKHAVCGACPTGGSFGGRPPAPALPPPGPFLTLESSDAGGGCESEDELWTDGSGEAGVRIRSRQEQAPLLLPAQAASKGSAFLSHHLLPSVPEAGGKDLRPVQGMGF